MFITLEGIDGSGKSTQAELLVRALRERCLPIRPVVWTREPGGWEGGDWIRERILKGEYSHRMSELFLFLMDRCEHVKKTILPALEHGIVICERYTDSTLAYQSWGRGIQSERIETLFKWCGFPVPNLTIWLDLPVDKALGRLSRRGDFDRFESEGVAFLERVREGYSFLARRDPDRIIRLDALEEPDALSGRLVAALEVSVFR
ncbi:MAG: dTMP kinase [Synergistaceae bacterium]|nr:dTMP kinase [Synergistaceae bacterium]